MEDFKICPYCGKEVPIFALKCKHCKELFDENDFKIGIVDSDCDQPFIYKIFNWIFNWLYEDEYSRNLILGMLIVFIFCLYIALKPYTTIAYAKNNNATLCHKANDSTCYKKMNILEQIEVYPEHYKKKGYLKTKQGEYIKETFITYKDTEEYKPIKTKLDKEKEEKTKQEEEAKKIRLTVQERKLIEDDLKNWENSTGKIFSYHENVQEVFNYYYINHQVWYSLEYKEKQSLLSDCMSISAIRAVLKDKNYDKSKADSYQFLYSVGTQIRDVSNDQVLAGMENGRIFVK